VGRRGGTDGETPGEDRVSICVREPSPRRPRRSPRRRSVLAETPAEPVHSPTAGPWPAVLVQPVLADHCGNMRGPFPGDVGVAIVADNSREKLAAAIASLESAGCDHARLLIVDVHSTDGTSAWLREAYPDVRVRTLDRNDGPNPGRNIGIRETGQPFTFLMD